MNDDNEYENQVFILIVNVFCVVLADQSTCKQKCSYDFSLFYYLEVSIFRMYFGIIFAHLPERIFYR